MSGLPRSAVTAAVAAVAFGASGCYAFIGRYGAPPSPGGDFDHRLRDLSAQKVPLAIAGDEALVPVFGASRECLKAPVVLRFAFLTDLQLRQHTVKLFSDRVSRSADNLISSFEYDELQEELGWAVYLAYVAGLRQYQRERPAGGPPLSFLVHGGDAVDSGTIEEMYRFVAVSNTLDLPWLDVVGNHDVSVFGNYQKRVAYTLDASVDFYPLGRRGFLAMHRDQAVFHGFGPDLLPVPVGGHPPSTGGFAWVDGKPLRTIPATACHGFDLAPGPGTAPRRECWDLPGYYAFDLPDAPVRVVVIDTTRHAGWGASAEFDAAQARWLTQTLAAAPDRTALVFGHHRPIPEVLEAIRAARHGRVFYFSGDSHRSEVAQYPAGEGAILELNVGSILEYPQVGRLVELRQPEQGGACLVARGIWPASFQEVRAYTWTDALQREWDACRAEDQDAMSLARASSCAHLGAMRDLKAARKRLVGAPQDPEAAWKNTNLIVAHPH